MIVGCFSLPVCLGTKSLALSYDRYLHLLEYLISKTTNAEFRMFLHSTTETRKPKKLFIQTTTLLQ